MTAFRGTPTSIRGWVALPPGYDGKDAIPDGLFGRRVRQLGRPRRKRSAANMMAMMADGKAPPMIWVYLDHAGGTGTHEFADSANNGPWGTALTSELIPSLEREYRMDARPSGRFLTGHSSGGWSTLWLQVRYPKIFGGSWPTSPDPSDFHDFTNVDLYAPNANFYADADGKPYPLIRDKGKVIASLADFARSEAVMGTYGGQIASFEWVFSPRGLDGRPVPLFDRATGRIDPRWSRIGATITTSPTSSAATGLRCKPDLDGKIHLTVGTADTFYLDGPAHRLEAVMRAIGAKTDFRYLPGKTHFDLYERGADKKALLKDIAWEMYGGRAARREATELAAPHLGGEAAGLRIMDVDEPGGGIGQPVAQQRVEIATLDHLARHQHVVGPEPANREQPRGKLVGHFVAILGRNGRAFADIDRVARAIRIADRQMLEIDQQHILARLGVGQRDAAWKARLGVGALADRPRTARSASLIPYSG